MFDPMARSGGKGVSSTDASITNSMEPASGQKEQANPRRSAIRALLVGNRDVFLESLSYALESLGIKTRRAAGCSEVTALICKPAPPDIIFTNTNLPDGNWKDVRCVVTPAARWNLTTDRGKIATDNVPKRGWPGLSGFEVCPLNTNCFPVLPVSDGDDAREHAPPRRPAAKRARRVMIGSRRKAS